MRYGAVFDSVSGRVISRWGAEGDFVLGEDRKFVELSDPPAEGKVLDVSQWPGSVVWLDDVDVLRADLLARLGMARVRRESAGLTFQGSHIATDAASLQRMAEVEFFLSRNSMLPSDPFYWSGVEMDAATFLAMRDAVVAAGAAIYAAYVAHKTAIGQLSTADGIGSYDLDSGWPG